MSFISHSSNFYQKINENIIMFRCYKCNNIPKINLIYNEKNNIEVVTRCKNNHIKKMTLENFLENSYYHLENIICDFCKKNISSYYCYNCEKFICKTCNQPKKHEPRHIIIDKCKYDCLCIKHNKKYNSYCKICEKNLCDDCVYKHKNNNCIIYFYEDCTFDSKKIKMELNNNDKIIEKVKNIKEDFERSLIEILNKLKNNFAKFNKYIQLEKRFINDLIDIFEKNKLQLNYEIIYNCINNVICYPNNLENLLNKIDNNCFLDIYGKIEQLNSFFLQASYLNKEKINRISYSIIQTIEKDKNKSIIQTIEKDKNKSIIQTIDKDKNNSIIQTIDKDKNNSIIQTIDKDKNDDNFQYPSNNHLDEISSNNSISEYEILEDDSVYCILELKNNYISAGLNNGNIYIYSNNHFRKCITMNIHNKKIVSIIEFKNGKLLSASLDKFIKISEINYSNNSYQEIERYDYHHEEINYVIELSSRSIISTSDSKFILWNKVIKTKDYLKENDGNKVRKIIQLKNRKIIMNHCDFFTIWEEKNSILIKYEQTFYYKSNPILLYEIKDNIYIIGNNEEFKIMDGNNQNYFTEINKIKFKITNCLSIENKTLLAYYENNIYKFNIENLKKIKKEKPYQIYDYQINNIIQLSNKLIIICGDDKKIKIFGENKFC